jgi:hypothetical protein
MLPVSTEKKGKKEQVKTPETIRHNYVRASRLAELSLIVDTGGIYQGEANNQALGQDIT